MPAKNPGPLAFLRQYARPAPARERCELCSLELPKEHEHLVELAVRRLLRPCTACAILFSDPAAGKYRRVSRRKEFLPDFRMTDVQWEGLQLPIDLAFFMHATPAGRVVAMYPSPARDRGAAAAQCLGSDSGRQPILAQAGAGRRGAFGKPHCAKPRILPGRHRRMLQAGGSDSYPLARIFRRKRGVERDWLILRETPGALRAMLDLNFQVEGAEPERSAAIPTLLFKVRTTEGRAKYCRSDVDPFGRSPLPGAN